MLYLIYCYSRLLLFFELDGHFYLYIWRQCLFPFTLLIIFETLPYYYCLTSWGVCGHLLPCMPGPRIPDPTFVGLGGEASGGDCVARLVLTPTHW